MSWLAFRDTPARNFITIASGAISTSTDAINLASCWLPMQTYQYLNVPIEVQATCLRLGNMYDYAKEKQR